MTPRWSEGKYEQRLNELVTENINLRKQISDSSVLTCQKLVDLGFKEDIKYFGENALRCYELGPLRFEQKIFRGIAVSWRLYICNARMDITPKTTEQVQALIKGLGINNEKNM